MTIRPPRGRAVAAACLALTLAGCSHNTPAPTPTPTPTERTPSAADVAAGEKALRAVVGQDPSSAAYVAATTSAYREAAAAARQEVTDGGRLTERGTTTLADLTYLGGAMGQTSGVQTWSTCAVVTGGIYDAQGRNVAVDPSGRAVDDKTPRRVLTHWSVRSAGGGTWLVEQGTVQEGTC